MTVAAFESNRAETATIVPVINAFKASHNLIDVTVVADAGMISEANQVSLHTAKLTYILGARIPFLPMWCANGVIHTLRSRSPTGQYCDYLVTDF